MSFLGGLFKAGGKTLASPVEAVGNVLDKLFTSKDEKLTHEEVRMRLMMKPAQAQIELNKLEAQHRSNFVAGWRPFIGWVCGIALAYNFIVRDLISWGIRLHDTSIEPAPELAMEHLLTVLLGMLGLGGLRTYEKIKKVAK